MTRARGLLALATCLDRPGDAAAAEEPTQEALALLAPLTGGDRAANAVAAEALLQLASLRNQQGRYVEGLETAEAGLALADPADCPDLHARLLHRRGMNLMGLGRLEEARQAIEARVAAERALGNPSGIAGALASLGDVALLLDDSDRARRCLQEGIAVATANGLEGPVGTLWHNLGMVEVRVGNPDEARTCFLTALDASRRAGWPGDIPYLLLGFALCASLRADFQLAATLHGAARALHDRNHGSYQALEAEMFDRDRIKLIESMGEAVFDAAFQAGENLDEADAVELAVRPN